jgi:hypothetical protein
MDRTTDDVLAAIDGALAWEGPHSDGAAWEADAMRWSGEQLETADQRRKEPQDPYYWLCDDDDEPAIRRIPILGPEWHDLGYVTDPPPPLALSRGAYGEAFRALADALRPALESMIRSFRALSQNLPQVDQITRRGARRG